MFVNFERKVVMPVEKTSNGQVVGVNVSKIEAMTIVTALDVLIAQKERANVKETNDSIRQLRAQDIGLTRQLRDRIASYQLEL